MMRLRPSRSYTPGCEREGEHCVGALLRCATPQRHAACARLPLCDTTRLRYHRWRHAQVGGGSSDAGADARGTRMAEAQSAATAGIAGAIPAGTVTFLFTDIPMAAWC